jgi:DNA-binding NtrC family response regulator
MFVRVLLLAVPPPLRRRLRRLAALPNVLLTSVPERRDYWKALARQNGDVLLVGRAAMSEPLAAEVAALRALPDHPEVVVLSSREDPEERAALLAAGSLAVIHDGISEAALLETLTALVNRRREASLVALRGAEPAERSRLRDFASSSAAMQALMAVVRRLVATDSSLLILGETGVGKEWLARAIHEEGSRAGGPFIAVNCGALLDTLLESELFGHELGAFTGAVQAHRGHFELAHGGTIFLDEVGDMPPHLQVKLLRVLQERRIQRLGSEKALEVDVRLMAATNRDLQAEVDAKRFRLDLYYRLGVVTLTVPPLRERREDIPALLESYLESFRVRLKRQVAGISEEAREALLSYSWPGNVRELINVLERAVLLCTGTEITMADLPEGLRGRVAAGAAPGGAGPAGTAREAPDPLLAKPLRAARREVTDAFERRYLEHWLRETGGRIDHTAVRAGIDPRSLFEKMRRLGLRKEDFRPLPPAAPESVPRDALTAVGRS